MRVAVTVRLGMTEGVRVAVAGAILLRVEVNVALAVGLNAAEGLCGQKGNRTARLESAMCSGRETIMALRISGAAGYLDDEVVSGEVQQLDRLVGGLYRLAYRR